MAAEPTVKASFEDHIKAAAAARSSGDGDDLDGGVEGREGEVALVFCDWSLFLCFASFWEKFSKRVDFLLLRNVS